MKTYYVIAHGRFFLTNLKSGAMTWDVRRAAKWKTAKGAEKRKRASGGVIVEVNEKGAES